MSGFADLPAHLKRQIDHAFETAATEELSESPAPRERRNNVVAESAGGFVVEVEPTAGGFMIKNTHVGAQVGDCTHIPLSRIPIALQLLDLQPDDEEVLSVFRNAASGWTRPRSHVLPDQTLEQGIVSREDWRAVCAVLLEPQNDVGGDSNGEDGTGILQSHFNAENDAHDDNVYRDEVYSDVEESDFNDSDEEYFEGASTSRPRAQLKEKSTRKPRTSSSRSASATTRKLTSRQAEECRRAFALFLPDVPADSVELDKEKIMIKDISRVATVLKEKITAEEIVEMLEAFSTSADKSVGLKDFERMMVTAKLA